MSKITEAIHNHHEEITTTLREQVAAITEERPGADPQALIAFLKRELLPHAAGEEASLYPAVDPLIKKYGQATATMTIDHEHIKAYVAQIEAAAAAVASAPPAARAAQQATLRRLCWQLEALLLVHLDKEERVYLPLFAEHMPQDAQEQILAGMHEGGAAEPATPATPELDVRTIAPRGRHELIFATFAGLAPGAAFELVNDHDPKPLYYQFQAEHTGDFSWDYLERGPEVWRVRIGRVFTPDPVGTGRP